MLRAGLLTVIGVVALSIPRQVVLADVIDGGGYTPEVPVEAELADTDAQLTDPSAPDPELLQAQNALDHFWELSQVKGLVAEKIIDWIGHHSPGSAEFALYVSVKRGTDAHGVGYVDIVKSRLPSSFEGFAVNVREYKSEPRLNTGPVFIAIPRNGVGDEQGADPPAPDAGALRAQNALDDFSDLSQVKRLVADRIIDWVTLFYLDPREAAIAVYVEPGTDRRGVSYLDIVKSQLPSSFEGFPVNVIESGDL